MKRFGSVLALACALAGCAGSTPTQGTLAVAAKLVLAGARCASDIADAVRSSGAQSSGGDTTTDGGAQ